MFFFYQFAFLRICVILYLVRVLRRKGFIMEQVLVAIISGLCVAIPSIIATVSSNKKNNDLVLFRINELDEKVHEHNNLIDRMYKVESRVTLLEDNCKTIKGAAH